MLPTNTAAHEMGAPGGAVALGTLVERACHQGGAFPAAPACSLRSQHHLHLPVQCRAAERGRSGREEAERRNAAPGGSCMLLGWLLHRSMHVFMAGDADAAPLGRAPAMLLALLALLPMLPCCRCLHAAKTAPEAS